MKRIFTLCITVCTAMIGFAQADTTAKQPAATGSDTLRIGGMIIIRKAGGQDREITRDHHFHFSNRNQGKPANISTNWWIVDLGFANVNDKTDYSLAAVQNPINGFAPGLGKDDLNLRGGKSVNVNIWFFMQRLNLIEHVVNLKYGLGLELNNYRFDDERVRMHRNPTFISLDNNLAGARKNKLAADYVTVPLMLNFNFTPNRHKEGFGFSAGVSAGYLYSARQKIKMDGHIDKLHDDFDLRRWKLSYIGELNLGPVKLYGSYAFQSMWEKALDQTPYTVGLRLSNW
ncbi:MAG TPA: outer membrane beta-barrel protein [Chitinophagaceae bacterium]|nr:outer membrane beta-barrel protein [Chitinophagaceae bacterium]